MRNAVERDFHLRFVDNGGIGSLWTFTKYYDLIGDAQECPITFLFSLIDSASDDVDVYGVDYLNAQKGKGINEEKLEKKTQCLHGGS